MPSFQPTTKIDQHSVANCTRALRRIAGVLTSSSFLNDGGLMASLWMASFETFSLPVGRSSKEEVTTWPSGAASWWEGGMVVR